MNCEIRKIICLSKFFKKETIKEITNITLEKPSLILLNNIRSQYLQYTYNKTHKDVPIYLNKNLIKDQKLSYGYLQGNVETLPKAVSINEKNNVFEIINPTELRLHMVYPKQDIMQHFIKWQRYRKYWWSSITTTPSLFSINDMKQQNNTVNVNTVANFPWGQHIVENIMLNNSEHDSSDTHLVCKIGLENALFTIMLDALSNATKEGYLRLHNKMAPFNIAFAIYSQDQNQNNTLIDLAKLINYKLKKKNISTFLPEFSLKVQDQVKENLQLGVTYTAILSDTTINNGIFHLLNSSTMLKEQIHIADFEGYAQKLCKK